MFLLPDMDFDALTTTAPPQRQLPVCCILRGLFYQVKMLHFVLVLFFTFSCLTTFGPWLTIGMQKSTVLEAGWAYKDDCHTISPDIVIADGSLGYAAGNPSAHVSIESVCANSQSFCFPPTLPGFSAGENRIRDADLEVTRSQYARPLSVGSTGRSRWASNESWSSDSVMFGIQNGQTISCFLNIREGIDELLSLQIQKSKGLWLNKNFELKKSNSVDLSPLPYVEIRPHVLEWGQKHLYFFSVAYLTVANTWKESILHVYEPFSTNRQFYPCNFSDPSLGPGERASICFVFLPRCLGLSLAHLILQTSTGGFLVQAKGYAVESPYEISSLLSLDLPSGGRLSKNLSLFNPFNETIYVKEISAWIQPLEVMHACLRQQEDSAIGYDHHSEKAALSNRRTGSLDNSIQMPSFIKAFKTAEADEFVLGNWKSQGTANSMSVLVNHNVLFPMDQVGNHGSKWISVKSPSQKPVVMQLILNSGEIIDEFRGTDSFLESPSSISLAQAEPNALVKCRFSMSESALTEAYVVPHGMASFGPTFFHPSNLCMWRSSALIRNNLSGVEWVSLQGFGGSLALIMLEGLETVETVEFNLNSVVPPDISPLGILFNIKEIYFACSQQFSKELYANIGDLPLVVTRIEVGTDSGLDGFMVHSCKGFSLEPGESKKLLISFHAKHSGSMVQKDLQLASDGGILVILIKANLRLYMLNFCTKSVLWILVKKFSWAALLPASIIFLILYCVFFLLVALDSKKYSCRNAKSSLRSAKSAGKSSHIKCNQKNSKLSMLDQMDNLLRLPREGKSLKQTSAGRYRGSHDGEAEQDMISQNVTPTLGCCKQVDTVLYNEKDKTDPSLSSKDVAIESSSILEPSESHKLAVRTGKEKGRKRRKRKGVNVSLMGLFEVSSSQSGNSTPTSPLSPATSITWNPTLSASPYKDPIQATSPFSQAADRSSGKFQISEPPAKVGVEPRVSLSDTCFSSAQEQPSESRKNLIKPVLLPSATFPSAGRTASTLLNSSSGASASIIAPHARAPGPNQKTMKLESKVGDKYTYDIWGEHFSGLNLTGSPKNVTTMEMIATENKSNSFFVSGPQVLVTKSQPKYVSCFLLEG